MRKNVAVITRSMWPYMKGGAEKFIFEISKRLQHYGYKVTIITRSPNGKLENTTNSLRLILVKNLLPFFIPIVSSFDFSIQASMIINKMDPDIVIVNGYWGEASPIFIRKQIPIIFVLHDVGLFTSKYAKQNIIKYILRVFVLRKATKRANIIIVPTIAVLKDLIRYLGINRQKIHVLCGEGVTGPFKRIHEENDYYDIVQVGRFAPNKGHLVTLRAFKEVIKKIPNARLWIVGGLSNNPEHIKYFRQIKEEATKINREIGKEAIKIIVNAPDVSTYYTKADVCIAPSLSEEGFGLTIIECMAYGKPVIASDIFVETGVASKERCLIFRRGDFKELSRLIIRLYKDKELYHKLSVEGLKYSRMHSWEKVAEVFVRLIESMIT